MNAHQVRSLIAENGFVFIRNTGSHAIYKNGDLRITLSRGSSMNPRMLKQVITTVRKAQNKKKEQEMNSVHKADSLPTLLAEERAKPTEPQIDGLSKIQMRTWVAVTEHMRVNGSSETAALKATGSNYTTYHAAKKKALASQGEAFQPYRDSEHIRPVKKNRTIQEKIALYEDVQYKMIEKDIGDRAACYLLNVEYEEYQQCEKVYLKHQEEKKIEEAIQEPMVEEEIPAPEPLKVIEVAPAPKDTRSIVFKKVKETVKEEPKPVLVVEKEEEVEEEKPQTPNEALFSINEILAQFGAADRRRILKSAASMCWGDE